MAVAVAVVLSRIIKAAAVNGEETIQIFITIMLFSLHGAGSAVYLNQGKYSGGEKRNYLFNITCCYATSPFSRLQRPHQLDNHWPSSV